MGIKADYLERSVDTILRLDPSLDREAVAGIVKPYLAKKLADPSIVMDNNVTGDNFKITLTELCNWMTKARPVVSGNATFYQQPEVIRSPASTMIRSIKKKRKRLKGKLWTLDEMSDEYRLTDLSQQNVKVVINAEYGGSGAPTAAFYTKYSPAATTLMAQSVITTMAAFFEAFVGDNAAFYHLNDCLDWLNCVVETKRESPAKWVQVPSADETFQRILGKFVQFNPDHYDLLRRYIDNCSEAERVYIYYANNTADFIRRHPRAQRLMRDILTKLPNLEASETIPPEFTGTFSKVKDYNKHVAKLMFMNPYEQPDAIKDELTAFGDDIIRYCFVEYLTPDSIVKLNDRYRNTVLLVDTDSNIIHADLFIRFILDEIFAGETFGRRSLYNDMIVGNVLASILSIGVARILDAYARKHFVENEEDRNEFVMKNEFYFRVLFMMKTKKRYSSSIVLREGNIMIPFRSEIKGMDFVKAGVADEVTRRFTKIIEDNVLFSDELNLHGLMRDFRAFEKEIEEDLRAGHTTYLKNQNYKTIGAYRNPWQLQTFKAVMAWNAVNPDKPIFSLSKIKLAKLIVTGPDDLRLIADDYPEMYRRCIDNIFNAKVDIRPGMTQAQRDFAEKSAAEMIKAGMKVIAIPAEARAIPEWIRPLLDYRTLVADVCNSFRSATESFEIDDIPLKTPNGKIKLTTGLISI